jgi:hypothetical protein
MNKEQLERYASIKRQIAALEEEADLLRPSIVNAMLDTESEKINLVGEDGVTITGSFTLEKKRSWEFSDSVTEAEEGLKELKAEEKATGVATYTEAPILKFITK